MVLRVRRLEARNQMAKDTSSQRLALENYFDVFLCLEGRYRVLKLLTSSPGCSHLSFLFCSFCQGPSGQSHRDSLEADGAGGSHGVQLKGHFLPS